MFNNAYCMYYENVSNVVEDLSYDRFGSTMGKCKEIFGRA